MISRKFLAPAIAAAMLAGSGAAALAEVEVKTPAVEVKTPSGGVNLDVDVGSKVMPQAAWVGRSVYSSDDKNLGEVAEVADDRIIADIGGFLGIGETRVRIGTDDIAGVDEKRIVLKLTEAEAKKLPAIEAAPEMQK